MIYERQRDNTTNIRRIVINLRKKRNIIKMAVINGQSKKKKKKTHKDLANIDKRFLPL